jgi:hypothetical protein
VIICKFGGTSVADRAAIERLPRLLYRQPRAAIEGSARLDPPERRLSLHVLTRLLSGRPLLAPNILARHFEHLKALRARHIEVAGIVERDGANRRRGIHRRGILGLERIVGALGVLREVAACRCDRRDGRNRQQPHRRIRADLAASRLPGLTRKAIVTAADHTAAAPYGRSYEGTSKDRRSRARRAAFVIGGFVGATKAGVTTTLGRNGSDTAAIIGACLGAWNSDLDRR